MTILDAIRDPSLFATIFRDLASWAPWLTFLRAFFGLPLTSEAELAFFQRCTGRATPEGKQAREAWVVVGRRGGKSRIAAVLAVWFACFKEYKRHLAPGEVVTIAVIAADRRQARVVLRYIRAIVDSVPMLRAVLADATKESITLAAIDGAPVVIEVHTQSLRVTRGYTLGACICDEIAFWRTSEDSSEPDVEVIAALRPGLATIPDAPLIAISSPYARQGALWEAYQRHFGREGDPVLVWQASTEEMNLVINRDVIAEAYERDEAAAAAEYGAQFRADVESFVSREVVAACVIPGRGDQPATSGQRYAAFVDPSGGSADSMTLAIGHNESGRVVIDALREQRAPFNPDETVRDFAEVLRRYNVRTIEGDRYAGIWPVERFQKHGISYHQSAKPKSDLYRDLLPLLTGGTIELPDNPRLIGQLIRLERRTARGGRDSIDHPPRGHDDLVNSVAGVAAMSETDRPRVSLRRLGL